MSARAGDVFEIATASGRFYLQMTHKDRLYGALVRVINVNGDPPSLDAVAMAPSAFYVFFPLDAAAKRKLITKVGNIALQDAAFPLLRQRGDILPDGRVADWWLWDGTKKWPIGKLTDKHRDLSLAEVVNDTLLIERLESGWRPSDVG